MCFKRKKKKKKKFFSKKGVEGGSKAFLSYFCEFFQSVEIGDDGKKGTV